MPRRASRRRAEVPRSARAQPVSKRNLQQEELLPYIEGPKTGPFKSTVYKTSFDFQFEELLDEPSSSGGGEGCVFKATLNGQTYAVKVFNFYDIAEDRFRFSKTKNNQMTDDEMIGNMDPFNAECRAYGRIEQIYTKYRAKNADISPIAVPCYGHVSISASHEKEISAQFGPLDFQRYRAEVGTPLRALVKEYNPHEPINPKKRSVKTMLRNLEIMHANGLYPIDIRAENYREGLLVDFGMALTVPSCVLRVVDEDIANHERGRGLLAFDNMIKEAGIKTKIRAANGPGWRNRTRAGTTVKDSDEFIQLVNRRGLRTEKQNQ